jgi:DNA repair exonuclease SbcCD ATPase subunit
VIIELTNFMSHDRSVIELPERGVVQITGPNGAGKSAVLEAVGIAMWGKGSRSLRWSPWRSDAGHVCIIDQAAQVVVERKWTGKAKQLKWRRMVAGGMLDFDTTTKAQEALDQYVGPFEVWRRTCVFSAADAAHFTMSTDAERKELLESLLGLGWFDRALTACRHDLRAAQTTKGQAERERDILRERLDGIAKQVGQAQELLAGAGPAPEVGLTKIEVHKYTDHLADVATEYSELDRKRGKLQGAGGAEKERAQQDRAKLTRLVGDACYACGQSITDALRAKLARDVQDSLAAAEAAVEASADELRRVTAQLEELNEEAESLRPLLTESRSKLNNIEHQRVIRTRLQAALDEQGPRLLDASTRILAVQATIDRATVDVVELEACEQVLGIRGARALLLGRTLAGIESLANTWMGRLQSDVRISLKPYTEKKSGGQVDSISLGLAGAGGDGGYLGASAGERRRVDVALLMSLAELASGVQGGGSWRSPIFFDEVFDSLDADGREAVMDVVEGLAKDRCVVLITHDEGLASSRADVRLKVDGGQVT